MSDEEKSKEEGTEKKGGKKKLIIIIIAVLVLVGGGVGAFFAFGKSKQGAGAEGEEAEAGGDEKDGEAVELPPAILPLDTFIVNLQVKGSFLKTSLQLEFTEPTLPHTIEHDTPKIRDAIIRVLSSKAAPDILSSEGKEKLREELRHAVNEALKSEDVTQVYITEFIIQ
ncbi:MAG: flagellar basal body-associated FliL family protein [Bdellovibrionota bacterium]